ncbi:endonuclease/exonuclease/phosphatase family protein [Formosa haliotis]|uniref:endonuclease/exonuclease/phosphatase family protein n=1 Tax=Formosa haliotis TaxID=1555194 RepID=UPI00082704F4|nr:endonuclease/exonuclease/phosphatase family protein [Formosa haliotis]
MFKLIAKYKAYLIIWYAFLLAVHFIFKDRFSPFIFVFNAVPLIFTVLYGFFMSVILYRHKTLCLLLLFINGLLTVYWMNHYYVENKSTYQNLEAKKHAILYWNVARKKHLPLDIIFENMATYKPEIMVLVEAKNVLEEDIQAFKKQYPDFEIRQLEGEMLIAVKGELNTIDFQHIASSSKYNLVNTTIHGHSISILIIDLLASPVHSKKSDLTKVVNIANQNAVDFVIGDFNTPFESYYFKPFNTNFESFHYYNDGYTATWPTIFPVLEIDHFWLNKRWQPLKVNKQFHTVSDHALLIGEFILKHRKE